MNGNDFETAVRLYNERMRRAKERRLTRYYQSRLHRLATWLEKLAWRLKHKAAKKYLHDGDL